MEVENIKEFNEEFARTIRDLNLTIEDCSNALSQEPTSFHMPKSIVTDTGNLTPPIIFKKKDKPGTVMLSKRVETLRQEAVSGSSTCSRPELIYFMSSAALLILALVTSWVATCITAMVILSYKKYHTGCFHRLPEAIQGHSESQMGRLLNPGKSKP